MVCFFYVKFHKLYLLFSRLREGKKSLMSNVWSRMLHLIINMFIGFLFPGWQKSHLPPQLSSTISGEAQWQQRWDSPHCAPSRISAILVQLYNHFAYFLLFVLKLFLSERKATIKPNNRMTKHPEQTYFVNLRNNFSTYIVFFPRYLFSLLNKR